MRENENPERIVNEKTNNMSVGKWSKAILNSYTI
jgi:hypothetical protein